MVLDDHQNMAFDPNHGMDCTRCRINGNRMDKYIEGCGIGCSDTQNYAAADKDTMKTYWSYAEQGSIADNYYHSSAGASSQNDMYFSRAAFVFKDNSYVPDAVGTNCYLPLQKKTFYDPTITSLLSACNVTWSMYAEGYTYAAENPHTNPCYPNGFDSSDIPMQYYYNQKDRPGSAHDYQQLLQHIKSTDSNQLPAFSFVKALGIHCEHPSTSTITAGSIFVDSIYSTLMSSAHVNDTLLIIVPDEAGGYYDHYPPPPTSPIDSIDYGPRTPIWALGKFAKHNYVSHTLMEHSSIVRFIEWNFLGYTPTILQLFPPLSHLTHLLLFCARVVCDMPLCVVIYVCK
jgi:phospholipase C